MQCSCSAKDCRNIWGKANKWSFVLDIIKVKYDFVKKFPLLEINEIIGVFV